MWLVSLQCGSIQHPMRGAAASCMPPSIRCGSCARFSNPWVRNERFNNIGPTAKPLVLFLCAQHGRWLEGERPLWRLIAPTISGRQGRCREARSGGSRKQTCGLRNTKRIRGCPSRASWQETTKPNAIKGLGSKCDKRAEKVNVLTWGDLLPSRKATLFAKTG